MSTARLDAAVMHGHGGAGWSGAPRRASAVAYSQADLQSNLNGSQTSGEVRIPVIHRATPSATAVDATESDWPSSAMANTDVSSEHTLPSDFTSQSAAAAQRPTLMSRSGFSSSPPQQLALQLRRASVDAVLYVAATLSRPETYVKSTTAAAKFVWRLDPSLSASFVTSTAFVISQKALLRGYFPYRWTLLACQQGCATLAMSLLKRSGWHLPPRLTPKNERLVKLIALLFTAEQLAAIVSLQLVTIPFHLSVRALAPLVTLVVSIFMFRERSTWRALASFLVVILGVTLTSHSISDIHSFGSLLTFAGMLLASAKSLVTTYVLQNKLDLAPLDIVAKMTPLTLLHAAVIAVLNGEILTISKFVFGPDFTREHLGHIALNAILSFLLVVFNVLADKRTQPPALAISTSASQALTILIAAGVFKQTLSPVNFMGVALTLSGGVLYAINDALDQAQRVVPTNGKLLPD
ncbi:hypothetical protein OIV83_002826 [Microbotryomycetes sp. JL201]|nr:hypothetical protein OIV83_002826 [Microbotryomycetes sp. JL201]